MYFDITVKELIENYTIIEQYEDDDVIEEYKTLVKTGEISLEDELSIIRVNDTGLDNLEEVYLGEEIEEKLSEIREAAIDMTIEFHDEEDPEKISDLDMDNSLITDNMYKFKDINGVDRYVIEK